MLDSKIVGGLVVDGTGEKPYRADVGIKDGKIVEVRRTAAGGVGIESEASETLDAAGRIVTPGFVDIHTHYDGQVTWDPLLEPSSVMASPPSCPVTAGSASHRCARAAKSG